jgi:hypothetical protein
MILERHLGRGKMRRTALRTFDLLPAPARSTLEKLGIDERFVRTWILLATNPSIVAGESCSRPFEFLSGSLAVYSTIYFTAILTHPEGVLAVSERFVHALGLPVAYQLHALEWMVGACQ